ncbi:hypothetical protein LARV_03769 [Longilinea arvoryzae]|uniref:Carboxypeptidase regulatory-like domain-containing protein n=1 Tax=Longilinea arvoryzae TaxID=360412 RepID=A0A0K8MXK2_9CHLR|nr:hypothetical protein [Longilinea arvoryzae]GAP15974.1 hypothetical protein LARV_03769 [Longilinea arvoryzae]
MKANKSVAIFLMVILGMMSAGVGAAFAQSSSGGRTEEIEITVNQYVWELYAKNTRALVCTATIEHDGSPTYFETLSFCPSSNFIWVVKVSPTASAGSGSPTPAAATETRLIDEATLFKNYTWRYKEAFEVTRKVKMNVPDIVVYLAAPVGYLEKPYVIISAYEPLTQNSITRISGIINQTSYFTCSGSRCEVPLKADSTIEYWAENNTGESSKHNTGTVRYSLSEAGYSVVLEATTPVADWTDACATKFGIDMPSSAEWARMPITPAKLNTFKTLHFLTGKLILNSQVDASSCPSGGFLDNGAPNSCAIELARSAVNQWQNQFDPAIWNTSLQNGVPAQLLKTIIETESQYWPGGEQNYLYEYGLAQINYLGIDTALRWDPVLFDMVCNPGQYDCSQGYLTMPPAQKAQLKAMVLSMLDTTCIDCLKGVNLDNAAQSINILSRVLLANCEQTRFIQSSVTSKPPTYDDMWKLTLVSYHSGFGCLLNALQDTHKANEPMDWQHISDHLACSGAKTYVESLWQRLTTFKSYTTPPDDPKQPTFVPTFVTPTPVPTAIPVYSTGRLRLLVYVDSDGNRTPTPGELVDGVTVTAEFSDGTSATQTIHNGEAVFDLSTKGVGMTIELSVGYLFRSYRLVVPESGEILYTIRLEQPLVPTVIP